ncbi:MAG: hypothetical protein R3E12_12865 [Candidatus Eisenbacteria bacterium]
MRSPSSIRSRRPENNSPPKGTIPTLVIDHHPCRELTRAVPFYDVRE